MHKNITNAPVLSDVGGEVKVPNSLCGMQGSILLTLMSGPDNLEVTALKFDIWEALKFSIEIFVSGTFGGNRMEQEAISIKSALSFQSRDTR